jgi:hypothetical protein
MRRTMTLLFPVTALALGACTVAPPPGPSVMAMPGKDKSFEAFQQDDIACRQYAWQQTGGVPPAAAATQSGVGSAVVGTALGAAAGAAIGSLGGAVGAGAAIGAATGLVAGSAVGANAAAASYGNVQQAYDVSYTQCIYAHGDTVQGPPTGYAGGYPYPGYPAYAAYPAYPYPYPYAYSGYYGPSLAIGFGGGWGWGGGWGGGWGWHGGGWHGGGGGWHH